jgi:hypothetical protein
MKFYLQFGHGMMAHCSALIGAGVGEGVILSPRDLTLRQLQEVANTTSRSKKSVIFDPQCYIRDADHPRLTEHTYWMAYKKTATSSILTEQGAAAVIAPLYAYNVALGTELVLLPGLMADAVTEDWLSLHRNIVEQASRLIEDRPIFATIALSTDATADEAQVEAVVEEASRWNVAGFYVVAQAAKYLVEDINWLANLMILTAGLKLLGKKVIVGYSNHQSLCLATANVDVIASGTWLNVRAFDPAKFYIPDEDEISRRTTWYYCPQALSEYKLVFLDAARRNGILDDLRAADSLGSRFADPLFAGPAPTSVNWPEQIAFRHYLTCLNAQSIQARKSSFTETLDEHRRSLDLAESLLKRFRSKGVLGGDREFTQILDINRSAVTLLTQARGAQLRKAWH